jgi:hypothetical protein
MHTEHVNITKLVTRMEIHCLPCYSFVQLNCAADSEERDRQYRGFLNIIASCCMSYPVAHTLLSMHQVTAVYHWRSRDQVVVYPVNIELP